MTLRAALRWTMAAIGALALMVGFAPGSHAASTEYVALGDSYSSGTGAGSYLDDGTECYRSTKAYPALNAAALGLNLTFRACSGATVADVAATQLSSLSASTAYVTISAGGNDAGFASVITECALPGWMSNCNGKIDGALSTINNALPGRLASLYASIRAKAPNAKVVVVGYPRIFMGDDCNLLTFFSSAEQSRLNAAGDVLNVRTAAAAAQAGFTFVNPTQQFTGHAWCSSSPWLNGLKLTKIVESYHPNAAGHRDGYAQITQPAFGVAPVLSLSAASRTATASSSTLVAKSATHAAADRSIRPQTISAPDLSSARAKLAAKKAGVDLTSQASIMAAEAKANAAWTKAWVAEHGSATSVSVASGR